MQETQWQVVIKETVDIRIIQDITLGFIVKVMVQINVIQQLHLHFPKH
jgi:hypothetical protein